MTLGPVRPSEKYRLLNYVVAYWMDHTKSLEPPPDSKLRCLAMYKTLSFEFRPWGANQLFGPYGCVSCSEPTKVKDLPFMSLFHYAAQVGHWSLMEGLVPEYCKHERSLDETLLIACRHGQDLVVRNLMSKFKFDIYDGRAVNIAAAAGHADILEYCLNISQNPADDSMIYSSYKFINNASSLLDQAVTNGHEKIIDVIFNTCHYWGVGVHEGLSEVDMRSALFTAVKNGHESIVRNLLAKGAKIEAPETTAVLIAAEYGHQNVLRLLILACENHVISGDEDGMSKNYFQILLRFSDTAGEVPLHQAARNGHSAAVKLILEHQPQDFIDFKSKGSTLSDCGLPRGFNALHLAARGGHLEVLKLLVDSGADMEADSLGLERRALHLAAAEGHEAVVLWLLERGCSPYKEANDGSIAIQLAVIGGHDRVVRALLRPDFERHGCMDDPIDMVHLIEIAAKNGKEAVSRILLDCIGASGERYLEEIEFVARRGKYHRALDLLRTLPGQRLWERDTEIQTLFSHV